MIEIITNIALGIIFLVITILSILGKIILLFISLFSTWI